MSILKKAILVLTAVFVFANVNTLQAEASEDKRFEIDGLEVTADNIPPELGLSWPGVCKAINVVVKAAGATDTKCDSCSNAGDAYNCLNSAIQDKGFQDHVGSTFCNTVCNRWVCSTTINNKHSFGIACKELCNKKYPDKIKNCLNACGSDCK